MTQDLESLEDGELVKLTRQGNKDAYAELWTRYYTVGMNYATGLTRSDPEDLVVEAYTKILRAIQSGKGPQDLFRPYLYATIRNVSITRHQKSGDTLNGLEEASWGTAPVEGDVMSHIDAERIGRVLKEMKPAQREILWLSEVEEHSVSEIAEELGISKSNVSTSTQRARQEFVRLWTQDHVRTDGVSPNSEHAFVLTHAGEYLTGKPSARVQTRIDAHLAHCEECAAKLEDAKSVAGMFRSRVAPAIVGTITAVSGANGQAFAAETAPPPMPSKLGALVTPAKGSLWPIGAAAGGALILGLAGLFAWPSPRTTGEIDLPTMPIVTTTTSEPQTPEPSVGPAPTTPVPSATPSPTATPVKTPPVIVPPAPRPVTVPTTTPRPRASAPAAPKPAAAKPAIVIGAVDTGPSNVCYPVASGTAQAGSTIEVSDGSQAAVAVRVDARGRWSSPALLGYGAGRNTLTASSPSGKQTADSAPATVAPPPQVAVNTSGGRLVVTLKYAKPGIPLDVSIDGRVVGSVTADSAGVGTYTTNGSLTQDIALRYHPVGCYGPWTP